MISKKNNKKIKKTYLSLGAPLKKAWFKKMAPLVSRGDVVGLTGTPPGRPGLGEVEGETKEEGGEPIDEGLS